MSATMTNRLSGLLRGESKRIQPWITLPGWGHPAWCVFVIAVGAGVYGAAIGTWRSPLQGAYSAVKLPTILILITVGNALLNALLAPLLGAALNWRQTLLAILSSFALAAAVLASFAPLVWFEIWSLPTAVTIDDIGKSRFSSGPSVVEFSILQLTNVTVVAFAGIASNLRLLHLLTAMTQSAEIGRRVLIGWLAGNFVLGTQLTWIFRPFFGSPGLPVQFLRESPLRGSFFESIWNGILTAFH